MAERPRTSSALRWFLLQLPLWSLLILLVAVALLVVLLRFLLPQLDQLRPELEARLNQQLPFELSSQQLAASLHRIDPRFGVHDLALTRNGETFLQLNTLDVELDTAASLIALAPRMKEVRLQELTLRLQETEQAGWQLAGWAPRAQASSQLSSPAVDPTAKEIFAWLEWLLVQGELDFTDIHIQLTSLEGQTFNFEAPHLNYRRWQGGRQLDFQLGIEGQPERSRLVVTLDAEFFNWKETQMAIWLHLDALQLADWSFLWPKAWKEFPGQPQGRLDLQAWLTWAEGGVSFEVRGSEAELDFPSEQLHLEDFAASLSGQDTAWQLDWQLDQLSWSGQRFAGLEGQLDYQDKHWRLGFKSLPLEALSSALSQVDKVPPRLVDLLQDLQPRGDLNEVHLEWGQQPWQLTSRLEGVAVNAWSAAPAVEDLDAWLGVTATQGEVIFNAQPLTLHFPSLYSQPFALDAGEGHVSWSLAEDGVWVQGQALKARLPLVKEQGDSLVSGEFSLQLSDLDQRFYLNLGLAPTQVVAHQQLVPDRLLPAALHSWLGEALDTGQLEQAGFIFAGSLQPDAEPSYQVQVDFSQTQLAFDPAWPELQQLGGWFRMDQGLVAGQVGEGQLLEAQLDQAEFVTRWQPLGQRLDLSADFTSDLSQLTALTQLSPLETWLPEPLQAWSYQGAGQGRLQLSLPFYDQPEDLRIQLDLNIDQGQVYLSQADLPLKELTGQIHFSLDQGLAGSQLEGQLWQEPFKASVEGANNRLLFSGQVAVDSLFTWLDWPDIPWVTGQTEVHGDWLLNPLDELQLTSSLQGVEVDLLGLVQKPSEKSKPLRLHLDFDEKLPWSLRLDDQLAAEGRLAQPEQGIGVAFADQAVQAPQLPGIEGVHLDIGLEQLDLAQWKELADDMKPEIEIGSEQALAVPDFNAWPAPLRQVTARVSEARWQNKALGPLYLRINSLTPGLYAELVTEAVIGEASWLQGDQPIELDLLRLKLPAAATREEKLLVPPRLPGSRRLEKQVNWPQKDPWRRLDPEPWPDVNWRLANLQRGVQHLGQWQGWLRTSKNQLDLVLSEGQVGESKVQADLTWMLEPQPKTQLQVQIEGENIAPALSSVTASKAPVVSGKHHLKGEFSWPGSPIAFYLAALEGDFELLLENGYFPETQGAALGASRVLGLMNLDQLLRRLRLDFSDVTSDGISFDRLEASHRLEDGYLRSKTPTLMQSSATRVRLKGEVDLLEETLDQELRITLPVGQTLPLSAVVLGAPQIGAALWLGQKLVGQFFDTRREALYEVQGPISGPEVKLKQLR